MSGASRSTSIVALRRRAGALCSVIAFPWAGAGAAVFHSWLPFIPDRFDLHVARLPGRESRIREKPCETIDEAADLIADEVMERADSPSTVLFGHSLGAILALATAGRLEERGRPINLLIVSGAAAPPARVAIGNVTLPADEDLWNEILRTEVAAPVDPSLRALLVPALRADLAMAARGLRGRRVISAPIDVYAGGNDAHLDELSTASWRQWSTATTTVRWFEGDHFFIRDRPDRVVAQLVDDADSAIGAASAEGSEGRGI
jgi:surfactin synthase thioesterase subunit